MVEESGVIVKKVSRPCGVEVVHQQSRSLPLHAAGSGSRNPAVTASRMGTTNRRDRERATSEVADPIGNGSTDSASQFWVCLACEIEWDKNRRKTKLCPECSSMGVLRAYLGSGP